MNYAFGKLRKSLILRGKELKEPRSPAILFEARVMVNSFDEEAVTEDEYKKKVARAVSDAIDLNSGKRP